MARLTIPSLQHLVRNWRPEPDLVRKTLLQLARHPPQFSYDPLHGAIRDLLVLRVPYEQVEEGIRRGVHRQSVRENLLEVLPLIRDHFDSLSPDFPPQQVAARFYNVARDIQVPFQPSLFYAIGGQRYLPWPSFWRSNPLGGQRLSLFVTLVGEMMGQDPELDAATFHILDFSIPKGEEQRSLLIIEGKDVPRVAEPEKQEMLEIWAEGYRRAKAELARKGSTADRLRILTAPTRPVRLKCFQTSKASRQSRSASTAVDFYRSRPRSWDRSFLKVCKVLSLRNRTKACARPSLSW